MSDEHRLTRQERRRLERARAKAYMRQPHIADLAAEADAGMFQPGTVTTQRVLHDDWCPIFTCGICRCIPDITYERGAE
jgi:hypothetical protein